MGLSVLGPLTLRRGNVVVESAHLRRTRVRELLCYLAAHRRARREAIEADLWPDAKDPAHNLRVTLSYVHQVLGELNLGSGAADEARRAAERVLDVDRMCEPAYRLLVRCHLARDDATAARAALARCRSTLAELGVEPDDITRRLEAALAP